MFNVPILLQQLKTGLSDLVTGMNIKLLSILIKLMAQDILWLDHIMIGPSILWCWWKEEINIETVCLVKK